MSVAELVESPGVVDSGEIESQFETALSVRSQASLLQSLQGLSNAAELIERRSRLMEMVRVAAMKRTVPEDWVFHSDRDGAGFGMLRASGAAKVSEAYGIWVEPLPGGTLEPVRLDLGNGEHSYRIGFIARSAVNGGVVQLEAERSTLEDFTGRQVAEGGEIVARGGVRPLDADLRSAVYQLVRTKAARVLGNMIRVPESELRAVWAGTEKTPQASAKGAGHGTGKERAAAKVADPEVRDAAGKLRLELLRRTGGDEAAARVLLRELTSGPNFAGFDAVARLTQSWQIDTAWERLRVHEMYGDKAMREEER